MKEERDHRTAGKPRKSWECGSGTPDGFINACGTGSQDTHLKAAKYSASPMGGSRPPVKAMLTLKPTPGPVPTCVEERNSYHRPSTRDGAEHPTPGAPTASDSQISTAECGPRRRGSRPLERGVAAGGAGSVGRWAAVHCGCQHGTTRRVCEGGCPSDFLPRKKTRV